VVLETLAANCFPESLIRLYVTGGDTDGFVPAGKSRLLVLVDAARIFPASHYKKGVRIKTSRLNRPIPPAKTVDYTAGIRETILAKREGFHEVAFADRKGNLLEGTQFNVIAVRGNQLVSPDRGILPGITVERVLKLGRKEGFSIRRSPISPALLKRADEVLITSTNREVMPAVFVDQIRIGSGSPGPVSRLLHQRYLESAE
jgi:branched-chain amino acid aminotransferase